MSHDENRRPTGLALPERMGAATAEALLSLWHAMDVVDPEHCEEYARMMYEHCAGLLDSVPAEVTELTGREWSAVIEARTARLLECVAADSRRSTALG